MIKSAIEKIRAKAAEFILPQGWVYANGAFRRSWGEGGNPSGVSVTPESSLQTVAVMRCVKLIAGVAASLPIDVIERVGDKREKRQNHPVERLLDWAPNPEMTAFNLRFAMWAHYLLWGNAYCLKVSVGKRVVAIWLLNPAMVEVSRDKETGDLVYVYISPKTGQRITYQSTEIIHVRNFTLDGITGLSAIQQAALAVGLNQAAEKTAAVMMRKGAKVSVVMEIPNALNPEQRTKIREAWAESNAGYENAGSLAIAEAGTKLHPLTMPAGDIQLLEQMGASDEKMCMIFGVPPAMAGITTKTTSWGTGIEMLKQGFLDFTLAPDLKSFSQEWERALFTEGESQFSIKHNTGAFLSMDLLKTIQALGLAIQRRILNPNEARAFLDLNGYDGGDEYFAQMQDLPIEAALQNTPGGQNGPSV
jgi:HK97 family phage portal protein